MVEVRSQALEDHGPRRVVGRQQLGATSPAGEAVGQSRCGRRPPRLLGVERHRHLQHAGGDPTDRWPRRRTRAVPLTGKDPAPGATARPATPPRGRELTERSVPGADSFGQRPLPNERGDLDRGSGTSRSYRPNGRHRRWSWRRGSVWAEDTSLERGSSRLPRRRALPTEAHWSGDKPSSTRTAVGVRPRRCRRQGQAVLTVRPSGRGRLPRDRLGLRDDPRPDGRHGR